MRKAFIFLTGLFGFTFAQENLQDLKRQLEEHRKLIQELERKIQSLEKAQQSKPEEKKELTKPEPADRSLQLRAKFDERLRAYQVSPFRQTAFLPDISFILDFSAVARNRKDKEYEELVIPRLWHRHEHNGHGHALLNDKRGFNLNYGELYLYAPVDPYFDLYATIPFSEDGAEIEEAYAVTRGLPGGLQLKVGKFRSGFGRLNAQHPHAWDFATQPLPNKVFLGDDGLVEKGIGINWLAPTPFYLLFGLEVLQGENDQSFGYKGFTITDPNNPSNTFEIGDKPVPNLYVGYMKTSFDLGRLSVLTGLSYAQGKHRHAHDDHGLDAKTKLYGFDLTARYQIDSVRYLALQGEYMWRDQDGTRYGFNNAGNVTTAKIDRKQAGFYAQLVGRFHKQWRAGVRYELINKNDVKRNGTALWAPDNLPAYYAMLEYTPTEFSRIRLQVGENRAFYEGQKRKPVKEVILQFNFAIGAHGAHPF
ncbi:MAG: hypothetical protein WHS43_07560 [Aquificaceae bacterium]|jgi:hypothetical protein|uniref:hypothetical protein n=1 Tax=Hydrogenobacter sp. Uz 6-8 TaxID=3384828 RepID=UPI0030AD5E00